MNKQIMQEEKWHAAKDIKVENTEIPAQNDRQEK